MTYKEKAIKEHLEINVNEIEHIYCPSDFNYNEPSDCFGILCKDCWGREIPEEE